MAAASKTLMEMMRPAKRIRSASKEGLSPKSSISAISAISDGGASGSCGGDASVEPPAVAVTLEQRRRMEFNKAIARSKRNLKLCADRIEKAKADGNGHVKLEELLVEDSWLKILPGELKKPYAQSLCKFVEYEIRGSTPIYPPPQLIFNALHSTPFDQVKAVIIGQDPYHGPGQAMGLSFSVPEGIKIPSSLVNIFKELEKDLGCKIPSHGNLERWAIQGVLLLNTVLTVRHHQANSHAKKGWEQFTDAVIQAISRERSGVVFLLWGNSAQAKIKLIDASKHHILKAAHPSGLSANRGFFNCKHFSQTNKILEKLGYTPIDWQL
ncbi:uracil-DNA glycosylase-like protein [Carex littledalei]|uniref:Uracil-DNA glycosylase n=1 Tax=Carex littledalei TaxID=544730 RepID=A0A833VU80_9POAL|nr:uracil-DNA glycosylase-like protein [Carex littledalei]